MSEGNYNGEIAQILFDAEFANEGARLQALAALCARVYEDGYDKAAHDITMKLQSCIPSSSRTVEEARIKGAWTDAAKISLNHHGKLSRRATNT